MRLTVLGAGPAYTDREGATGACYLVSEGDTHLLLDLGQGSFPRVFAHVPPTDLAAVVVSHLHPDHFIDLVPMRHFLRYEFDPPRRMRVFGPGALAERLDALHAEPGFAAEALDIERLGESHRRIGALGVDARLIAHTEESYGIRVAAEDGPGIVYSGDCGRASPRWSGRAMRSWRRSRSGRGPCPRASSTWTARPSGGSRRPRVPAAYSSRTS